MRELLIKNLIKSGLTEAQAESFAEILLAQAKHETNKFTSKSFTEGNNLFGMKVSSRGIASGELFGHAAYDSKEDSIIDMIKYLESSSVYSLEDAAGMTPLRYATYLKSRKYYEDTLTNYYNGIVRNL